MNGGLLRLYWESGSAGAGTPVEARTQARAFGAFSGRRYGSFSGRAAAPDVGVAITQLRAFGAFSGRRYGSFADREDSPLPPIQVLPGFGRIRVPLELRLLQRQRIMEDEELLAALLVAAIPSLMRRH